ncbi:MAG: amino acid adenylation domain-containing protein [Acidobacteriota bacterium]|nr:amino acid adenylation domain-containing protein [Acidobacteriota bacterium]
MNGVGNLINLLTRSQIRVWTDNGKLRYEAPRGAVTPHLRQLMQTHKTDLIAFLETRDKQTLPALRPRPKDEKEVLSFVQRRIWLQWQLEPQGSQWHMPAAYRLSGMLDPIVLEDSMGRVVARHRILQTCYPARNGQPTPQLAPKDRLGFKLIDLSGLFEPGNSLKRLVDTAVNLPFKPEDDPLIRFFLFRLSREEHVLLTVCHHLISDAESFNLLLGECAANYTASLEDRAVFSTLPDLQYADLAHWQRQLLTPEVVQKQMAFWRRTLTPLPLPLRLPDDPDPDCGVTSGTFVLPLEESLMLRLKQLARREKTSLFALLLAAFKILLYRLTGQPDVTVGAPISLRKHPGLADMIGCMLELQVLRNLLRGNPCFRILLASVHKGLTGAGENEAIPFEMLTEELSPKRGGHPFFDILFNYIRRRSEDTIGLPGVLLQHLDAQEPRPRYPLTAYILETDKGFNLKLAYRPDRFSRERMAAMADQFHYLLEQLADDPDKRLEEFSLWTLESRNLLPDPSRALERPAFCTVWETIETLAETDAEATALIQGSDTRGLTMVLDYEELVGLAARMSGTLIARGLERGEVVAVESGPGFLQIAGMLAVFRAGGVLFNIDPDLPPGRLKRLVARIKPRFVLTAGSHSHVPGAEVIDLKEACRGQVVPPVTLKAYSPAYLFFTSGTTGVPKAVLGTHQGLAQFLAWQRDTFNIGPGDRFGQLTALSFDVVLRDILTPLTAGATLCLPVPEDQGRIAPWLAEMDITHLHAVPSVAAVWLDSLPRGMVLKHLRTVFFAGESLPSALVQGWRNAGAQEVINLYGPTETTLARCWYRVPPKPGPGMQPVGFPLPHSQALVLRENLEPCGIGETGEVFIRTPFRTLGYAKDPIATAQHFIPNPHTGRPDDLLYRSGDLGRFLPDGNLALIGRRDHQLKIHGVRIDPNEIASVLTEWPRVSRAVVGLRSKNEEPHLVAWLTAKPGPALDLGSLRQWLTDRLPRHMIPSALVEMETLPLGANGKVDRAALPGPDWENTASEERAGPPQTPVEKVLAEIWSELLPCKVTDRFDDFFARGGQSLMLMRVLGRIAERLEVRLTARQLFRNTRLDAMARAVVQADEQKAEPILPSPRATVTGRPDLVRAQLSMGQRGLWALHNLNPESAAYTMHHTFRLDGPLSERDLTEAFFQVQQRHEILRAHVGRADGAGCLIIHPQPRAAMTVVDLTRADEEVAEQLARQEAGHVFDLTREPLIRLKLLRLSDTSRQLLLTQHHVISDAWSVNILLRDIAAHYNLILTGRETDLPKLNIQFADYASWQQSLLTPGRRNALQHWWREYLAGAPQTPALPVLTDNGSKECARAPLKIRTQTVHALGQLGRAVGITPAMIHQALLTILLTRLSDTDELVFGCPVGTRERPALEPLIGFFVNTLVYRIDMPAPRDGRPPGFKDLLQTVREQNMAVRDHRDLPTHQIIDAARPKAGIDEPLFRVLLAYQNAPFESVEPAGVRVASLPKASVTPMFDLCLELEEDNGSLHGFFEGRTDLSRLKTLAGMYTRLAIHLAAHPNSCPQNIPLMDDSQRHALTVTWNRTDPHELPAPSISETIASLAARAPERIAVEDSEGNCLSYAEFWSSVTDLAGVLRKHGAGPGTVVGLRLPRSSQTIISLIAVHLAEAGFLALDQNQPEGRCREILQQAGVSLVIAPSSDSLKSAGFTLIDPNQNDPAPTREFNAPHPSSPAYLTATSGTGGKPKLVCVSHGSLAMFVAQAISCYGFTNTDRVLQFASPAFDTSIEEIFPALCAGATLVVREETLPASAERFVDWITRRAITLVDLPTSFWNRLVDAGATLPDSVRLTIVGGEAVSPRKLATWFQNNSGPVVNGYGPCECTVIATVGELKPDGHVPIGRPIHGARVYLVDRYLDLTPPVGAGMIAIGGNCVGWGYPGQPGLTASAFVPDPFSTDTPGARLYLSGDRGRFGSDNLLYFLGRRDHQVKLRGYRIELDEIAFALEKHPSVASAAVILRGDTGGNRFPVAFIVAAGESSDHGGLRTYLAERLPAYCIPAAFVTLNELPLNSNGKLDRTSLAAAPLPQNESEGSPESRPRTWEEKHLAAIWCEVLNKSEIGRQTNFFELGGDSIRALQVVTRARQMSMVLNPRDLFEHPTIQALANQVRSCEEKSDDPWAGAGELPPTPIQRHFFAMCPLSPHHYNQATLWRVPAGLETARLRRALQSLVMRHDALRQRFQIVDNSAAVHTVPRCEAGFDIITITDTDHDLEAAVNSIQAGLNLEHGPLIRAALLKTGQAEDRLLITVHHLAVDAWSWRILLEDFCQLWTAGHIESPESMSWRSRAHRLARREPTTEETRFWNRTADEVARLPPLPLIGEDNFAASAVHSRTIHAPEVLTQPGWGIHTEELLLTALAATLTDWTGQPTIGLTLEHHGRNTPSSVDVTRTVGWFTTVFPLLITRGVEDEPLDLLRRTATARRAVPAHGLGYTDGPLPRVLFNYLGSLDDLPVRKPLLGLAEETGGRRHAPNNPRGHLLEINAAFIEGKLQTEWRFPDTPASRKSVESLTRQFEASLLELTAALARNRQPLGPFPADYPLCGLDLDSLDRLILREGIPEDIYPAGDLQAGLLYHLAREGKGGAYHIQIGCKLTGPLDERALRKAWEYVVFRHTALRTRFIMSKEKGPLQWVETRTALQWYCLDLWGMDERSRDQCLEEWLISDRERGFDPAQGPLLRFALFRAADSCYFVWSHHHLLLDGWSAQIVLRDVFTAYEAFTRGESPNQPPAPDFRRYMEWLSSCRPGEAETFWRQELADLEGPTPLPASGIGTYGQFFGRVRRQLDAETTKTLNHYARTNHLTRNTLVQGAWALLTARYNRQTDILFGTTLAGRPPELPRDLVGLLIRSVPIRLEVDESRPTGRWLNDVQQHHVAVETAPPAGLTKIREWAGLPPGLPLFEALVVVENYPAHYLPKEGVAGVVPSNIRNNARGHDPLTLVVNVDDDAWRLRLDFAGEHYAESTANRLLKHFTNLLKHLTEHVADPLHAVPMMTVEERKHLLRLASTRVESIPGEPPLIQRFFQQAEARPDSIALRLPDALEFTYGSLAAQTRRIASVLRTRGAEPETPIAVFLEPGPQAVVAVLGILASGAPYLPLDPAWPSPRIETILAEARPNLLVTESGLIGGLPRGGCQRVLLDYLENVDLLPDIQPRPQHAAHIIYTSGSTGSPKGVAVTHAAVARLMTATEAWFQFGADDVVTLFHSIAFDFSVWEIWSALAYGGTLIPVTDSFRKDPRKFYQLLIEESVTVLSQTPTAFAGPAHVDADRRENLGLRLVIFGGEALPPALLRDWRRRRGSDKPAFVNMYGITETTVHVTRHRVSEADIAGKTMPIGNPLPHLSLYVLDGQGRPVAPGQTGELYVGGAGTARGYVNRPGLTASRFVPDGFGGEPGARLYRSGDLACLRENGMPIYLGRGDRQLQLRGYRVEPAEIEAVLTSMEGVTAAVVLPRKAGDGTISLVAWLQTDAQTESRKTECRNRAAALLPAYMMPAAICLLQSLPLTPNGKLDRKALPDPESAAAPPAELPETSLEQYLTHLFSEILDRPVADRKANFFDLGGHSINALSVVNRIQEQLGEVVHVAVIFEAPTPELLARRLMEHYPDATARVWGDRGDKETDTSTVIEFTDLKRFETSLPQRTFDHRGPRNPSAVFILCPPRSGSTLLRVMMGGHPRLFAPPELALLDFDTMARRAEAYSGPDFFWGEGAKKAIMSLFKIDADEAEARIDRCIAENWSTGRFYNLLQEAAAPRILVDKTPGYALQAQILARAETLFENARYIHLLRDPRAVIASFREAHLDQIFARGNHNYRGAVLGELVWTTSHRNILDFLQNIPEERRMALRFEDLVTRPEDAMDRVCDFLDLKPNAAMLDPYQGDRMTDGPRLESRMLGDLKFHNYTYIDPSAADRGHQFHNQRALGQPTLTVAKKLGYGPGHAPKTRVAGRAPLSLAQRRLWFLDKMQPNTTAYVIPISLDLKGPLDTQALASAFDTMTDRHEALRTCFPETDGEPEAKIIQRIQDLPVLVDLSGFGFTSATVLAGQLTDELMQRPFQLADGPLIRARLFRLSGRQHRLAVQVHHLIFDGWSAGVMARELSEAYRAEVRGLKADLPELKIQYGDYAAWQLEQLPYRRAGLAWWRQKLKDAPPLLPLPADRPRPAVRGVDGAEFSFQFSDEVDLAVHDLARKTGCTVFHILAAGFALLLHRYSDCDDIIFGVPSANRNRPYLEPMIGFFVNTLILRSKVPESPSVTAFAKRIRRDMVQAMSRGEVPFEQLVAELDSGRDPSHEPLIQAFFAMQNAHAEEARLPGISIQSPPQKAGPAKFDLSLYMADTGETLIGTFEYDAGLYDRSRIQRMAGHYRQLVTAMTKWPNMPVGMLPLIQADEAHNLLKVWNRTDEEYENCCIHQFFERQAAARSYAIALVVPGTIAAFYKYGELDTAANRLAHKLQQAGVGPEHRVGVCLEKPLETVVSLLAVLKAGAAYVPLEPSLPQARLNALATDAGLSALLTEADTHDRCKPPGVLTIDARVTDTTSNPGPPKVRFNPDHPAYLLYTSGTSGKPKGVLGTHRAYVNRMQWMWSRFPFQPGEVGIHKTALSFIDAAWEIFGQLGAGIRLVSPVRADRTDPSRLADVLSRHAVTRVTMVPSLLSVLLEKTGDYHWPSLWISSGETLSDALAEKFRQRLPRARLVNLFGMTEAAGDSLCWEVTPGKTAIGRPLANTRAYVLDRNARLMPIGVPGELYIGGIGPARGYHGDPAATAAAFVPDPFSDLPGQRLYRTGDKVRCRRDGAYLHEGRMDLRVKLRGYRIDPAEIEGALFALPAVKHAVVTVETSAETGPRLVARVQAVAGETIVTENMRRVLSRKLPHYMIPSQFQVVEDFPRTQSGKIDLGALQPVRTVPPKTRKTPTSISTLRLQALWSAILGREIGLDEDFFAAGGHSLAAARLAARIGAEFGKEPSLVDFFKAPTITAQAVLLEEQMPQPWSPLVSLQRGHESQTPLVLVHPVGGQVLAYAALVRALGPEVPVYGLQAQGLQPGQEPRGTLAGMAAAYRAALGALQKPFSLAGWSFGGLVAHEIARGLIQESRPPRSLFLIDSHLDLGPKPNPMPMAANLLTDLCTMAGTDRNLLDPSLPEILATGRANEAQTKLIEAGLLPPDLDGEYLDRYVKLFRANIDAAHGFRPKPYPGMVHLIRATEKPESVKQAQAAAWRTLQANQLKVTDLAGNHYSLLTPPAVQKLAELLKK